MTMNLYFLYSNVENVHFRALTFRDNASHDDLPARKSVVQMLNEQNDWAKRNSKPVIDTSEFELHKVATFDDESGVITPLDHYVNCPLTF